MTVSDYINLAYAIGVFLATAIPCGIALFAAYKQKRKAKKEAIAAKNDAEKAAAAQAEAEATTDMLAYANTLVEQAEDLYKTVDTALKQHGKTAGPAKKDSVMSKLQIHAIELAYTFDYDKWSKIVDDIVKMTKNVNAK